MQENCLYLRKSRLDLEAEAHGEGDTLARHERLLLEVAKRNHLEVTKIYREIVSGETIASRPVMQQLLQEVEQGVWSGVLVVEVERLARGDTIDQGIVAQAFKYSGTKIYTPQKVYDPTNEFDEEYFEFGLFMSRREYKTINRRLVQGRVAASKEGKFASGSTPYGYERVRVESGKGWTLRPVEEQAEVVRLIFRLYTEGEEGPDGELHPIGSSAIAVRLRRLGILSPTGSRVWSSRTVTKILSNPVYVGKIRWGERRTKKVSKDGKIVSKRFQVPIEEQLIVPGLHPAIVDEDVYNKAAEIMARKGPAPVPYTCTLTNPLAGLVICGKCGRAMQLRSHPRWPTIRCPNHFCDNVGLKYSVIEERLLQSLSGWLSEYRLNWSDSGPDSDAEQIAAIEKAIRRSQSDTEKLRVQLNRTYDLLEQGVYDTATFLDRSKSLADRISAAEASTSSLTAELEEIRLRAASKKNIIPKVEKLLEVYSALPTPQAKNDMLKEVLEKVVYVREKRGTKNGPFDNFELTLYPKLPPSGQ